jgi:hypothetical protein
MTAASDLLTPAVSGTAAAVVLFGTAQAGATTCPTSSKQANMNGSIVPAVGNYIMG